MKTAVITDNSIEAIEFRANESRFALVHQIKSSGGDTYKTIIMNWEELMALFMVIQDEVLNKKEIENARPSVEGRECPSVS